MMTQLSLFPVHYRETTKKGNQRMIVETNGVRYIFPISGSNASLPNKQVSQSKILTSLGVQEVKDELGIEMGLSVPVVELIKALEGKEYEKPRELKSKPCTKPRIRWFQVWQEREFVATHSNKGVLVQAITINGQVYYRYEDRGGGVTAERWFHYQPIEREEEAS
jgi:hypothetical protein